MHDKELVFTSQYGKVTHSFSTSIRSTDSVASKTDSVASKTDYHHFFRFIYTSCSAANAMPYHSLDMLYYPA
jgi:hypothetical protein